MNIKNTKMGIAKSFGLLVAMELIVFLLGYTVFYVIGAFGDEMENAHGMAAGVFHSWFGFVLLGIFSWIVLMVVMAIARRRKPGESEKL